MRSAELLVDAFDRIQESVYEAVGGLSAAELAARLDSHANSIGWLVWHLTRIQDDHVADVAGDEQTWTAKGWSDRFGLPFPVEDTGFGHTADDVSAVRVSGDMLTGYHDAVHDATVQYVEQLDGADLDRIVDERWTPPVSLGVRLVSVISDDLQHAGQAGFIHGVLMRQRVYP